MSARRAPERPDRVEVAVADTGSGIPEHAPEDTVNAMDVELTVESEVGVGSVFRILLPVSQAGVPE